MPLIRDPSNFLASLERMHKHNEGLSFKSVDEVLKIFIRPSYDDDEEDGGQTLKFDVFLVYDETEDLHGKLAELLHLEYDGYFLDEDEGGDFFMATLVIPRGATPSDDHVREAIDFIENVCSFKVCGCFKYLIKDSDMDLCYFCQMTSPTLPSQNDTLPTCIICQDPMFPTTMKELPCCKQSVHCKCFEKWLMPIAVRKCPLCRSQNV